MVLWFCEIDVQHELRLLHEWYFRRQALRGIPSPKTQDLAVGTLAYASGTMILCAGP